MSISFVPNAGGTVDIQVNGTKVAGLDSTGKLVTSVIEGEQVVRNSAGNVIYSVDKLGNVFHPTLCHFQATQNDGVWKDWVDAAHRGFKAISGNVNGCFELGAAELEGQRLVCKVAGKYLVRLRVYTAGSITTGRLHLTKNNGPAFSCWIQNLAGEDHTNEAWAVFDMAVNDWFTYHNGSRVYLHHNWDHTCVEVYKIG